MAKTKYFGIQFPTQVKWGKTLFDLNMTKSDMVKSQLIHLIFTPQGEKLRDPLFGTNLIKYLFDPNDEIMWADVEMEIKDKVKKYIPNCEVIDITTGPILDDKGLSVNLKYTVVEDDGVTRMYELQQTI